MKRLLAFTVFLFCSSAMAFTCPDFTGRYKWVDELDSSALIKITVTQTGCTGLREEHDQGWGFTIKHDHVLDGIKRLVEDSGTFQAYETATLDSSGLHIMEDRHSVDESTGKPVLQHMKIEITHPEASQLVIKRVLFREDMTPIEADKTIYTSF
jgi:hypothetical protein